MILHQQLLHPKSGPLLPWLALHVESLQLAYCSPDADGKIHFSLLPGNDTPVSVTTVDSMWCGRDALQLIAADIYHHLPNLHPDLSLSKILNPQSPIPAPPDYLLVNSLDGTTPGILHTGDPTALYLARQDTSILQPAEHFRSSVDLTVEGWTYWWEDAQRAFLKLTIEFAQACGTAVPEHIAEQVRHL